MGDTTPNFEQFNTQQNKNICVIVSIDGVSFKLSNRAAYTKVKYGDPGIYYGQPGLVYGSFRKVDGIYELLSLERSSLSIQQRLEPEQGRASISQISMSFIDLNGIMTQLISPGVLVKEIMGRQVTIELGYQEISYPDDYIIIFRGIITGTESMSGLVSLSFSDPNIRRRQNLFFSATTKLTSAIDNSVQTIPVSATGDFHQQVLGPDGNYDVAIKTYIKIDDEFMEYGPAGIGSPTTFINVTRGSQPNLPGGEKSTPQPHDDDSDVYAYLLIEDHAIDMALKLMLSGWGTYWITGEPLFNFVQTNNPDLGLVANAIVFPLGVDVRKKYGLVEGDYITTVGATDPANNFTLRKVVGIFDLDADNKNRYIVIDGAALVAEINTDATLSIRSQFDTYPDTAGLRHYPIEIDIQGHLDLKFLFLADIENSYRFLLSAEESGKTFIETELYFPVSCYSITRQGQMSVKMTMPPLGGSSMPLLNKDNILNPQNIRPQRSLTTRTFYNEIDIEFDEDTDGNFTNIYRVSDFESYQDFGMSSTLTIKSRGLRSDLATNMSLLLLRRANYLLSRYKRAAIKIDVDVNCGTGNQIEAGDIVILDGDGLNIANLLDGTRVFGKQLFEVVDRRLNIGTGVVSLGLISGVGADVTDRFASISPSSVITGGTTTQVTITESFIADNPRFPGNEYRKWENYIGQKLAVHSVDYSFYEEVTFISFDSINKHKLNISALSAPPSSGYILDISRYPSGSDKMEQLILKQTHLHVNPSATIVTGINNFSFTVSSGDAAKILANAIIRVHSTTFSSDSKDVVIDSVVGTTITVKTDMGFTPSVGMRIDLIGFLDGAGPYRWI